MVKRRNKVIRIALILLGIGALYAAFVKITGIGIPCPFHLVTGLKCPGCGVSRMCMSLVRLDFASAFRHNAAILCLLPLMAAVLARQVYIYVKSGRTKERFISVSVWFMIVVLLAFGVLRNVL